MNALAARLGLEAASLDGHALRSGFLTSAAARGFQAGRSVAAQEHGHAAGLRPGRRDFQAPCRGRLVVGSLLPNLLRHDQTDLDSDDGCAI